jgi:O-antigen/teichoic acid export membrane protein
MFRDGVWSRRKGRMSAAPMQLLRRRLLSGGAWAFGGKILIAFTGLISSALLARLLSRQEAGVYVLAYSIVSLGTTLGALGLTGTVVRLVAMNMGLGRVGRVRRVVGVVVGVGTLGALGVGLAYLLFGNYLAEVVFESPALAAVSGLVAGWIVVGTLQGVLGETFRGFHDIRLATVLGGQTTGTATGVATMVLLSVSLFLLWLAKGQATLATVILLAVCSGAATTLLSGWLLRRKVAGLAPQSSDEDKKTNFKAVFGEVLSVSWPLLVTAIVMFTRTNVDVWVLGAFRPQGDVALYGFANRLVAMVTMPLIMVNAVVPPLVAEMYSQGRTEDLERALRGVAALSGIPALLASMGCIFFAGPIMGLVFGDDYRGGAIVLALLSVGLLVSVLAGSCGVVLTYSGHQKTMMTIALATGTATFAGMLVVVGPYGIAGVATVRMAGQILQNGLMLVMAKRRTGMWTHVGLKGIPGLLRATR